MFLRVIRAPQGSPAGHSVLSPWRKASSGCFLLQAPLQCLASARLKRGPTSALCPGHVKQSSHGCKTCPETRHVGAGSCSIPTFTLAQEYPSKASVIVLYVCKCLLQVSETLPDFGIFGSGIYFSSLPSLAGKPHLFGQ